MAGTEDDGLVRRLRALDRASRPRPSRDPVMKLVRAEASRFSNEELHGLGIDGSDPERRCRARARVSRGWSTGMYSISVAVPEMILCGRPRGHTGDHVCCPTPVGPLAHWAARHRRGRWGHRWPGRAAV